MLTSTAWRRTRPRCCHGLTVHRGSRCSNGWRGYTRTCIIRTRIQTQGIGSSNTTRRPCIKDPTCSRSRAVDTAEGRCSLGRMLMSLTNATLSGQFSLATDRPDCSRQSDFASLKSVIRGVNRPVCSPMHMHLRCQPPTHTCGVNRPISPSIHPAHPAHPSHPDIQR